MKNSISLILLLGCFLTQAQFNISGVVKDSLTLTTVSFVSVSATNLNDSNIVKTASTDEHGNYVLNDLNAGTYTIEFYAFGFEEKTISNLDIQANKTLDVTLKEEDALKLDDIVAKAKRPTIKQNAEKLIVDLEQSNMANNNLQDVMKRIPGMAVTNNGISFAGRSDLRILINGKTTEYMDIQTLLKDFPADQIARVELIEQPGAEYDAEGSGPIIDIILKKNVKLGTYGNINAWIGEDEGLEYGGSASIASYKNKLNWQANTGYSRPTWREDLFIKRKVGNVTYNQETIEPYKPESYWIGGNVDYFISENHSIGFGSRFSHSDSDRESKSITIISNESFNELLSSKNNFDRARKTFNINPYYEFKNDKNKLTADFNFVNYSNNNVDHVLALPDNTVPIINRRYLQNGDFQIKTYKVDYVHTFSDVIKLSLGTKMANVDTDSDLKYYEESTIGEFEFQEDSSNRFSIDETILAFYSKVNIKLNGWSFSGGLRFEDSDTKGTSSATEQTKERKISKLFPSASLSKTITKKLGVNLAYSYRIKRPSYNSLNSFVQFYDPLSSEVGNPNLKPAFTNNYQFNLTYSHQPFFTIGYSKTRDNLFSFISQNDETAQIQRSMINLPNRENWNFRLFGPLNFVKKLDGFTGFIVNHNKFESNKLNPELKLKKWSLAWFTQATYSLPWNIDFELSSYFSSGMLQGQIDSGWIGSLDFSLAKKFMDDKLNVSLSMNNVLNRGFVGVVDYDNVYAEIEANGSRQNVQLRLSYRFGSKYAKKKNRQNSSRDEEARIDDNN